LYRYTGAGTGLILNPVVLTHFLATLAVLVHAAQNATQWLVNCGPGCIGACCDFGDKTHFTDRTGVDDDDADQEVPASDGMGKEAAVLTTALELVLVVLDGCLELDGGRSLGLENTALLLGAGEWAGQVFSRLEKGARVRGGGGAQEIKLKRAAAGVLLKVDELTSRWRRSMVDVR
jgi:telomere length regulation protein